jgi:CRISPR/Cas system CSM-associated protein Csm3 (group 7 of RAMP superfamily)
MISMVITVKLRMDTPGGVTAQEALPDVDNVLPLRRDTTGRPHLPGTTVAGSLRAHCATYEELGPEKTLFGIANDVERIPSSIQVLGTRYLGDTNGTVRHRTAIDRERGAPANTMLHGVTVLPAGTEFDIVLSWDNPDHREEPFLRALQEWRPRLGRGASHDAGRCSVVGLGHRKYDLTTVHGLHTWLHLRFPDDYPAPEPLAEPQRPLEPDYDVTFEIIDGLHISAGKPTADSTSDGPIINEVLRSDGRLVVPGSTLKGNLRSRAEYVCRVVGAGACADRRCGECHPCRLFGFSGESRNARRAKIAVSDSVIDNATTDLRTHVAIDRFTGGAREQLLFTDEVVTAGRFRLRVYALEPLDDVDRLLIDTVLTDLHDGLVGIGGRTTAGLGTVRITSEWTRPDLTTLADRLTGEIAA